MYKLLKVLFIILLVLTITEAGYYIIVLKFGQNKKELSEVSNKVEITPSSSPKPSVSRKLPFLMDYSGDESLVSKEQFDYIYDEYLPNIAMLKKSKNRQIALVQKDFGFVEESLFSQGWLHIRIVDEKGDEVITYRTSKPNIKYLKFYKLVKGIKTPITYEDIKKGDKITHTNYKVISNPVESYNEYLIE